MTEIGGGGGAADDLTKQIAIQNVINNATKERGKSADDLEKAKKKESKDDVAVKKELEVAESGGGKTLGSSHDKKGVQRAVSVAAANLHAAINHTSQDTTSLSADSSNTIGTGAADYASAAEALKADLQKGNSPTFSRAIVVAAAGAVAQVQAAVGGVQRRSSQSDNVSNLSGPATTSASAPSASQLATVAKAKAKFNKDVIDLKKATAIVYQATGTFNQACKEYGSGSPIANKAEASLNKSAKTAANFTADAFFQVTKATAFASQFPAETALKNTAAKMKNSFQETSKIAYDVLAIGAAAMKNPPSGPSLHLKNGSIFGGYNPAVLAGSCVTIQIMKAMAKMEDVANTVAARQTKIEKGMENIQTRMNNYLSQQLAAENPILSKLAALGKKEASASQVSTGLLSVFGNSFNIMGGSLITGDTKAEKGTGSYGHGVTRSWENSWKGMGQTLGFCPGTSNVQGEIVATNGRLSQLNSENQVATQKVSNLTTEVNAQGQAASSSAQSVQSLNQMMTSILGLWAKAMGQAISSG